jgi:import inner membrane translocase subunit TIM23
VALVHKRDQHSIEHHHWPVPSPNKQATMSKGEGDQDFTTMPMPSMPTMPMNFDLGSYEDEDVDYLEYDAKGRSWGERMFFNTGVAYMGGIALGGFYGVFQGLKNSPSNKMKIRMNSVLNQTGNYGSRFGNAMGSVALMYSSFESCADQWEIEQYIGGNDMFNPVLASAATGILYKSTKGPKTMALAGMLGAVAMGAFGIGAKYIQQSQGMR